MGHLLEDAGPKTSKCFAIHHKGRDLQGAREPGEFKEDLLQVGEAIRVVMQWLHGIGTGNTCNGTVMFWQPPSHRNNRVFSLLPTSSDVGSSWRRLFSKAREQHGVDEVGKHFRCCTWNLRGLPASKLGDLPRWGELAPMDGAMLQETLVRATEWLQVSVYTQGWKMYAGGVKLPRLAAVLLRLETASAVRGVIELDFGVIVVLWLQDMDADLHLASVSCHGAHCTWQNANALLAEACDLTRVGPIHTTPRQWSEVDNERAHFLAQPMTITDSRALNTFHAFGQSMPQDFDKAAVTLRHWTRSGYGRHVDYVISNLPGDAKVCDVEHRCTATDHSLVTSDVYLRTRAWRCPRSELDCCSTPPGVPESRLEFPCRGKHLGWPCGECVPACTLTVD
eukprot:744809-Amphidinium_carterae.1